MILLIAFWHSVHWFVVRTADTSDEPWGLISLATLMFFCITSWNRRGEYLSSKLTMCAIALLSIYCVGFSIVPPLVRCLIAFLSFGVVIWNHTLAEKRNFIALFGLIILSTPLLASLQFFAGFPLRLLVTNASAAIIRSTGTSLSVLGTTFEHHGRMILVDSPCSGISMLWAGCYLCFVLCLIKRLSFLRSVLLCAITLSGVVATNVGRTTTLVFIDILKAAGQNIPEFAHDAVGISSFVSLALLLVFVGSLLAKQSEPSLDVSSNSAASELLETSISHDKLRRMKPTTVSFAVLSAVACLVPFFQRPVDEQISQSMADWPDHFEGCELKPVKLSSVETKFSSGFPGRIAKFTDGRRTILFRQVTKPTRQLHPSIDCYKGNCFQLHPMAALRDTDGRVWSRFHALKDGRKLEVREIVSDAQGHTWSDTSAWYWSALLGKTQSPWVAVTVATVAN